MNITQVYFCTVYFNILCENIAHCIFYLISEIKLACFFSEKNCLNSIQVFTLQNNLIAIVFIIIVCKYSVDS